MPQAQLVRGRFAPSPSGRMHLGNLWSCLLAWLAARSAGGEMVLRLEDLDPDRCRAEYCDQVMRDLEWLGLDWDGAPMYQSRRTEAYAAAFETLGKRGLVYPCYCTRAERLAASAPHRSDGAVLYDGRCRRLPPEERKTLAKTRRPAWRVQVPKKTITFCDLIQGEYKEELTGDCGDFILRRSDGVYAYQLAVVVDDGAMGVTQVVRGSDLLDSTPRQLWLQEELGLPHPQYGHVPLLLAPDGRRLAKRDRDAELGQLKERYTAPELVGRLAHAAGLIPEYAPVTPEELIPLFSWDKVPREDMKFSIEME
ncbi:MAG: tRNA glutamyl-Q(34) synthetase GluQRS [Lawsonibacter sp.]|nr:tRNA glutamyl-Q(34) synthetase GluQRS [Lawsonibacter sp.]